MPICVIFNPAARGQKASRFRRHLGDLARDCVFKPTHAAGAATFLAKDAINEGFDTIVAAGGDGTINEVVSGIADAHDGFARARLGVLPLGTVNVFAKELGLPMNLSRAWDVLRQGRECRIDVARVDFQADGMPARRHFAQLAGAGLDARAIELVSWKLKKRIGPLAYVVAGLKALRETQPALEVQLNGRRITGQLVLVGNGRFYGGRMHIFPHADLRDGLLDICVFRKANWATLFHCGATLLTTSRLPASRAQHFRAESFRLTGTPGTSFEVDGEFAGKLPATFSVEHQALRVLVT